MPKLENRDVLRDLQAGVSLHRAGRIDEAETLYRKVLKRAPNHPDALNLLGVIAHERGRLARAVQLLSQAIRAKPRFPEALANLARSQRVAGDREGSLASARQAVALGPNLAEAQVQLGCALLDAEDYQGAADAGRKAIALAPNSLDAHVNLGAALTQLRDWQAAAEVYQVAHALKPDRAETLTDFAIALQGMELLDAAESAHQRAIALAPNDARVHASHAMTLKRAQDAAGVVAACRRTVELAPRRAEIWLMLAHALATLGQFAEAMEAYNRTLELDPDSGEARRGLVIAGRLAADEGELQRLHAVADDPAQPVPERISAGFALGALFDKAGHYDQAFACFHSANRAARETLEATETAFDIRAFRQDIDAAIAGWTPQVFARMRDWGDPSELPVFIVGMPRSGTTLTEQIAASHPRVFGAGELRDLSRIAATLARDGDDMQPDAWDRESVRQETARHLARLRSLGGSAARVTDKMPDNILRLGAIATLFPGARIVLCRRDLRDVCLSCYFQHFNAGLSWARDLTDMALRVREVERLVTHWRTVLPVPLFELDYETLVADLEGESRRLIDFLGLEWDPSCLAFHKTERQILTASLWQVRQPLYASSVGRWRHYRAHLAPLLEGLGDLVAADPIDPGSAD